jgi:transaldolase
MANPLQRLSELGQSVWIDFISREALASGQIAQLIDEDEVVGLTSNPTIFEAAISHGDAYDDQMRELQGSGASPKDIFIALASRDITDACALLRPVYDRTSGLDGYVSMEVDPTLAHEAAATIAEARSIHDSIDRPNLLVKIPATVEGLQAIEETIAGGISVNVTLIFSLERHREVAEAYISGLERRAAASGDLSAIASVASFFVSRVDTEVDKRLDAIGGHDDLKGRLGIDNAKLAYQTYEQVFAADNARWAALAAKGATPQRCLWASTSTKNPAYRDVMYVEGLLGPATVNTMPVETVRAFADHGIAEVAIDRGLDEAQALIAQLAAAGVDYDDVTDTLEREGVEKFKKSFESLLEGIAGKRDALVGA